MRSPRGWGREENALSINSAKDNNKLVIPVVPRGDYELIVRFRRVEGSRDVVIYIPDGTRQATAQFGVQGQYDMLGKKYVATTLENDKEYEVRIKVLHPSAGSTTVSCVRTGGETKYQESLSTPPDAFTPADPAWTTAWPQAFALGADSGKTQFLSARVKMLTGHAERLKDGPRYGQ